MTVIKNAKMDNTFHIRMPITLYKLVVEKAREEDRTISMVVRRALIEYIKDDKGRKNDLL